MTDKIALTKSPVQKSATLTPEDTKKVLAALATVLDLGDVSVIKQIGIQVQEKATRVVVLSAE